MGRIHRGQSGRMLKVVIESPLAGDFQKNIRYARLCGLDCIRRGEAPYASHLLMTQFLDDTSLSEREVGMKAGLIWSATGELVAVYIDLGISDGMKRGIAAAETLEQPIEYRKLPWELWGLLSEGPLSKTLGM